MKHSPLSFVFNSHRFLCIVVVVSAPINAAVASALLSSLSFSLFSLSLFSDELASTSNNADVPLTFSSTRSNKDSVASLLTSSTAIGFLLSSKSTKSSSCEELLLLELARLDCSSIDEMEEEDREMLSLSSYNSLLFKGSTRSVRVVPFTSLP